MRQGRVARELRRLKASETVANPPHRCVQALDGVRGVDRVADQLRIQLPDHLNFKWRSDRKGRYAISGRTPDEHEVSVMVRTGMPTETFKVQVVHAAVQQHDLNLNDAHFLKDRVVDHDGSEFPARRFASPTT